MQDLEEILLKQGLKTGFLKMLYAEIPTSCFPTNKLSFC